MSLRPNDPTGRVSQLSHGHERPSSAISAVSALSDEGPRPPVSAIYQQSASPHGQSGPSGPSAGGSGLYPPGRHHRHGSFGSGVFRTGSDHRPGSSHSDRCSRASARSDGAVVGEPLDYPDDRSVSIDCLSILLLGSSTLYKRSETHQSLPVTLSFITDSHLDIQP